MDNMGNRQDTTYGKELESLKRELEDVKCKLDDKDVLINSLEYGISKAKLLLDEWAKSYVFYKAPDPLAAINYGQSEKPCNESAHAQQSYKWFIDYDRVCTFIEMATDYVTAAQRDIAESEETTLTNAPTR